MVVEADPLFKHENFQKEYGLFVNTIMKSEGNGPKVRRFLTKADPWLIAIAKEEGLVIVSDETNGSVKIPQYCETEEIACLNPLGFFRECRLQF